jgi:hypothetical protein
MKHGETVLAVRLPAARISSQPVLVTNLDVVEGEGLRVSEFSATFAPGGVGWAAYKLNLVESVIDEGL